MIGLLGSLASGAAYGYQQAKNAETELNQKVELAIIGAEYEDLFKQRVEARKAQRSDFEYARDRQVKLEDAAAARSREDEVYQRDREDKLEDFDLTSQHDLNKLGVKHSFDASLEGMKEAGRNMKEAGRNKRAQIKADGLLNTGSRSKDAINATEKDQKRIFDLKKELSSPMVFNNAEQKNLLEQEIERLEFGVKEREALMKYGNTPLNLNGLD